jgi:hypothetical protein
MVGQDAPDGLASFIHSRESSEWAVQITNRTGPDEIKTMVEELFGGLSIETSEAELAGVDEDLLLLLRDGEVVQTSPLSALRETLLLVNSDLYRTGTASIEEIDPPDVIVQLSDTVFSLRGYPASHREKLVLTLVARFIEQRAWSHERGTLRTSFQRLSRIDDERGTREVYERLGEGDGLDVHVYGIPDWEPPDRMPVTVHEVTDDEIMRHWFVVYRDDEGSSVAMVATKAEPHRWLGFWTFDADEIERLDRYITRTF